MDDQGRQDLIERYLDGKLSAEEEAAFKTQLEKDGALAKAYALEETARLVIATAGREELRNRLETYESAFDKKAPVETSSRQSVLGRWLAVAATLLVLVVVGLWLFNPFTPPADLFTTYFEPYRPPSFQRSATTASVWQKASESYAAGDYEQAARLFEESLLDTSTITYLAHFYHGQSLLAQTPPRAAAAANAFDKVLNYEHDYRQQTLWFQALAWIQSAQKEKALIALKKLQTTGDYRAKEVNELVRHLD